MSKPNSFRIDDDRWVFSRGDNGWCIYRDGETDIFPVNTNVSRLAEAYAEVVEDRDFYVADRNEWAKKYSDASYEITALRKERKNNEGRASCIMQLRDLCALVEKIEESKVPFVQLTINPTLNHFILSPVSEDTTFEGKTWVIGPSQIENLQLNIDMANESRAGLIKSFNESQELLSIMQGLYIKAKARADALEKDLEYLKQDNQALESALPQHIELQLIGAEQRIQELETENKKLSLELAELRQEMSDLDEMVEAAKCCSDENEEIPSKKLSTVERDALRVKAEKLQEGGAISFDVYSFLRRIVEALP